MELALLQTRCWARSNAIVLIDQVLMRTLAKVQDCSERIRIAATELAFRQEVYAKEVSLTSTSNTSNEIRLV
jgi:hypothetical protein